jgi:serine/threonine-protein kinase
MASTTVDLLATLEDLTLLAPGQLAQARQLAPERSPSELLRELVRRGWLTTWQANRLARGALRELSVGSYQLLEPLGEGGMGKVFKARHTLMDRTVALKFVRPDLLAQADAVARFRREIRVAARLNHPNIVLAHDAQRDGNRFFLVLEFCQGIDLARLVRLDGPLSTGRACEYARQVALGLQHLFEHGLIHRDIKPANLLVSGGIVKILDLGLARLRAEAAERSPGSLTLENVVLGTADFLAPEQVAGARAVDIRADLYSLGCSLYFMLTGRPPFPGGSALEKVLRHLSEEPTPLERLRPEVPEGLRLVVRRLMARAPADRYADPQTVAEALAPWSQPPDLAVPPPLPAADSGTETEVQTINAPSLPDIEQPTPLPRRLTGVGGEDRGSRIQSPKRKRGTLPLAYASGSDNCRMAAGLVAAAVSIAILLGLIAVVVAAAW